MLKSNLFLESILENLAVALVEFRHRVDELAAVRVEDLKAVVAGIGYALNFISNTKVKCHAFRYKYLNLHLLLLPYTEPKRESLL